MRLSFFFNRFNTTSKKSVCNTQFDKEMAELIQRSKEAMQEISNENFNSETLRTLFTTDFKPKTPRHMMAISTTQPQKPVEVGYKIYARSDSMVSIDVFSKESEECLLGHKEYFLDSDKEGNRVMESGYMSSDKEACEKAGVKGIGTIENILQVIEAIKNGIRQIPRNSYARATLFHLKMGFTPVQQLEEIDSIRTLDTVLKRMTDYSALDISSRNYTPIIVAKDGKYYLDENTTQCIANLRQIRQNYRNGLGDSVRPFIRGRGVTLELSGKNYDIWKDMIAKQFKVDTT